MKPTSQFIHKFTNTALILAVFFMMAIFPAQSNGTVKAASNDFGIACATPQIRSGNQVTYNLTAKDGQIQTPDGNSIYVWSFALGDGTFQYPGPVLCVKEGDIVTVAMKNTLPVDTSLTFPGQDLVISNGSPSVPVLDQHGSINSLSPSATANGGSAVYTFTATHAGTFYYQSGTDPYFQNQMGLFGALVVRPTQGDNYAYNDDLAAFNAQAEILMVFSDIDPILHQQVMAYPTERPDMSKFLPIYFLINGRIFPDTIAQNYSPTLPNQPYSSLAIIEPYDEVNNPIPALQRYINLGNDLLPFHPHGNHGRIIGRDGHLLRSTTNDLSYEKFSVDIAPGQTYDSLFAWKDEDSYSIANPIPITIPNELNLTIGQFFSGSPYLGINEPLPPGSTSYNQCGEFYHVAHNHALQALTSWGITGSGQLTYTRINPPGGCH